jgi:hypothetical protein
MAPAQASTIQNMVVIIKPSEILSSSFLCRVPNHINNPKIKKKINENKKIFLFDSSYIKVRASGGRNDRLNIPSNIPRRLKIDL